jgi:hypothetical protein
VTDFSGGRRRIRHQVPALYGIIDISAIQIIGVSKKSLLCQPLIDHKEEKVIKKEDVFYAVPRWRNGCLNVIFIIVVLSAFLLASAPRGAQAIPAFSRHYKTECTTCHTLFAQRNEFGEAFRKNGYVWPGDKPSKQAQAQTEEERKLNEALLLAGLPTLLPVSLQATFDISHDRKAEDRYDFKNYEVELFAAGTLRDTIGFFMNEVIASSEAPGETELEEAFVIWRHALDAPINVKGGKLRPDVSIWKSNNWLIESKPATVQDINGFALKDPQNGIELNAVLSPRFFAATGMVDRTIGTTSGPEPLDQTAKEYYGHVSYKIGGTDYRGKESDIDFEKESIWDFLSVSLGAFGYNGKTFDDTDNSTHNFYRTGLEAGVVYKKLSIMLGWVQGQNKYINDQTKKSAASSAEIDYLFTSKLMGLLRYDVVSVDEEPSVRHFIPAIAYSPVQSSKIVLSVDQEKAASNNTTAMLRAQIAF